MSSRVHRTRGPSGKRYAHKSTHTKLGGSVDTADVKTLTLTVIGSKMSDIVHVSSLMALPAGLSIASGRVSAPYTVAFNIVNPTPAQVNAGNLNLVVRVNRYDL